MFELPGFGLFQIIMEGVTRHHIDHWVPSIQTRYCRQQLPPPVENFARSYHDHHLTEIYFFSSLCFYSRNMTFSIRVSSKVWLESGSFHSFSPWNTKANRMQNKKKRHKQFFKITWKRKETKNIFETRYFLEMKKETQKKKNWTYKKKRWRAFPATAWSTLRAFKWRTLAYLTVPFKNHNLSLRKTLPSSFTLKRKP